MLIVAGVHPGECVARRGDRACLGTDLNTGRRRLCAVRRTQRCSWPPHLSELAAAT